eukprot:scaffold6.g2862.t1
MALAALRAAAGAGAGRAAGAPARLAWVSQLGGLSSFSSMSHQEDEDEHGVPTTPWYNKGLAFSDLERDRLHLRGLLPPAVLSQEVQAERVMINMRSKASNVDKLVYLFSLQARLECERNERLFYSVLAYNIEELLPLFTYPTLGEYCQAFSLMFRSLPRGMFISLADKGNIFTILKNWPERRVKAICLTDGSRVGPLGDLGAIAVPISRLAMYTACGGLIPSACLPVTIDTGTNNQELLSDPIYVGVKHRRVVGDPYFELVEEFFMAVKRRFGSAVMVDLEGMSFDVTHKLINTYRGGFPMYSDCLHGLPTSILAAILAALPVTGGTLGDHRFMLVGESPKLTAVAELLEEALVREKGRGTVLEARKSIFLVDSKGLLVRDRADAADLEDHKLPYIQDSPHYPDLLSAVRNIKPTVLVGLSDGPPPFAFNQKVCKEMAANAERPILFALTRHDIADGTHSEGAELTAAEAYAWTDGRCFFLDRSPFEQEVALPSGKTKHLRGVHTVQVFPGVAMGALLSRSTRLREDMFVEAAKALARLVTDEDRAAGALFPPIAAAPEVSLHVAAAVAGKAYAAGESIATELPKPHDLLSKAEIWRYNPAYRRYR